MFVCSVCQPSQTTCDLAFAHSVHPITAPHWWLLCLITYLFVSLQDRREPKFRPSYHCSSAKLFLSHKKLVINISRLPLKIIPVLSIDIAFVWPSRSPVKEHKELTYSFWGIFHFKLGNILISVISHSSSRPKNYTYKNVFIFSAWPIEMKEYQCIFNTKCKIT